MEMHQARYFLAVCETMNFTRAAASCNVAQPSLTRAIKKLEDELGGPLFRRERNRTHLTDLGRLVQPHLEQLLDASHAVRSKADSFGKLETAPLRLGVMCTIGPLHMVPFFTRFRHEVPGLEVSIREARGGLLVEELIEGALDLAIIGLPSYPERLDARRLYTERYVIAFAPGHRFEQLDDVPLSELNSEDYLMRVNCEYPEHLAMESDFALQPQVRYQSEREDWIQAMVAAGLGCSIMPEHLPAMSGLATRPLDPAISRGISLVTVAGRRFSPTVAAFVREATRHDWQLTAAPVNTP